MQHKPRRSRLRPLSALGLAVALGSCSAYGLIAPFRTVDGIWRGAGWGLEATDEGAALHRACGDVFPVVSRLAWDHDLRARGTTASHEFHLEALPDGRIALRIDDAYNGVDTLERSAQASFDGVIICE